MTNTFGTTCDRIPIAPPELTDADIITATVAWLDGLPAGVRGSMSNAHRTDSKQYGGAWRVIDGSFGK